MYSCTEAYNLIFDKLNELFHSTEHENDINIDELAGLLSDMSMTTFLDQGSADPAEYERWCKLWNEEGEAVLDVKSVRDIWHEYLTLYGDEVKYDFSELKSII